MVLLLPHKEVRRRQVALPLPADKKSNHSEAVQVTEHVKKVGRAGAMANICTTAKLRKHLQK